jgi:hypothetical protein
MSETTESQAAGETSEQDDLSERWLEDERSAYEAAQSGDYDLAIGNWSAILADDEQRAFFAAGADEGDEDGPVREIAASLADAYLRKGDKQEAIRLINEWHLVVSDAADVEEGAGA